MEQLSLALEEVSSLWLCHCRRRRRHGSPSNAGYVTYICRIENKKLAN